MTSSFSRDIVIQNMRGLHARAASKFCTTAAAFDAKVTVTKDDMTVGGCSLMALLMLGAGKGSTITLRADGAEAEQAIIALSVLIDSRFDEVE